MTEARSRNMRAIRGKDTKPELYVRSVLHRSGFRFRLHVRGLPGTPDLYLARYRLCLFVNGCFWHGHACDLFRWPKTKVDFWREKITHTQQRDCRQYDELIRSGYRVGIVWECSIKGINRIAESEFPRIISEKILDSETLFEIKGITA